MAKQLPMLSEIQYGVLMDALDDAIAYRLGEADNVDDPELDPMDRGFLVRYYGLVDMVRPTGGATTKEG